MFGKKATEKVVQQKKKAPPPPSKGLAAVLKEEPEEEKIKPNVKPAGKPARKKAKPGNISMEDRQILTALAEEKNSISHIETVEESEELDEISEHINAPRTKKTKSKAKKKSAQKVDPPVSSVPVQEVQAEELDIGFEDENPKEPRTDSLKVFEQEDEDALAEEKTQEQDSVTSLRLQRARNRIWLDLRDGIDLKALAKMDSKSAREEVASAVQEISRFRNLDITPAELDQIARECADDMLGYGPLESLLDQDGIADIMINGPDTVYLERHGKIERAAIRFRDNQHLTTICQRIVGAIGRRVDESSPICDARLPDGSRVNVIIPPLAVDGSCMTIRKFTREKLTLDKLVEFGSVTESCAKLIMAIGRCRVNILVSGGTGSGKTTMLNCLTRYIDRGERIVTCEDACELQLQQPHVVRLETRPPNLEGVGEVTMRDLVKNCLRMRPERIIVGEVRGPEAFDLLQAMNTGHDGSMGTVHANNPREALSRMENMIAMGGLNLPSSAVREQIASAVNVIIQVQRLRDGSRTVTHISEITGMEGAVVTMQDLFVLDIEGEDEDGKLIKTLRSTGLRPKFFDQARQFGVQDLIMDAMEEAFD